MFRLIRGCRTVFMGMTVLAFLIAIPVDRALAALVDTQASKTELDPEHFRMRMKNLLAREDVKVALLHHGINPTEVEARIAAMTDKELSQFSGNVGALPAAAGGEIMVFPLGILILILLGYVLVITGIISLGVYAGAKLGANLQKQQEEEYAKTTPYPAPPRVGPVPSVNPDEPWTGAWKVADGQASGVYVFKQTDDSVVSTPESDFRVEAKVYGAMISGAWFDRTRNNFKAIIADDFLSFKGDINSRTFFTCQKIESKSAAVNVKPSGPWAGKWNVQGASSASGLWALKQEGETVTSTDESYYRVRGKAAGDKFEGDVMRLGGNRRDIKFNFVLSSDGKSFDGYTEETTGTKRISGIKVE